MDKVAGKPVATDEHQVSWEFSESESWSNHENEVTVKVVAHKKATGRPVASSNSENSWNPDAESRKWPHNFLLSPAVVPHMESVYSIVRKNNDRDPTDSLADLNVNTALWGFLMNVTLQAAVHLGRDYMENLRLTKNQLLKSVKQFFKVTEKLITDQTEISGLTTIDCEQPMWKATTLQCDKVVEITNAKTYVFSDSVLCLGGISDRPVEAWENRIKWHLETCYLRDLNRIDGEPMEFEWTNLPGFTTLKILDETQKMMTELQCEPEHFIGRIIFMSLYNDIVWENEETKTIVLRILLQLQTMLTDSRQDVGHFWDQDPRRNGMEPIQTNRMESGTELLKA